MLLFLQVGDLLDQDLPELISFDPVAVDGDDPEVFFPVDII